MDPLRWRRSSVNLKISSPHGVLVIIETRAVNDLLEAARFAASRYRATTIPPSSTFRSLNPKQGTDRKATPVSYSRRGLMLELIARYRRLLQLSRSPVGRRKEGTRNGIYVSMHYFCRSREIGTERTLRILAASIRKSGKMNLRIPFYLSRA